MCGDTSTAETDAGLVGPRTKAKLTSAVYSTLSVANLSFSLLNDHSQPFTLKVETLSR